MADTEFAEQHRLAHECWAAGLFEAAVTAAWRAYDAAPQDREAKILLADLLHQVPSTIEPDKTAVLLRFLQDPEIEPESISNAGWILLRRTDALAQVATTDVEFESLAARLDNLDLAQTLLHESIVLDRVTEQLLTRLRCWLLISGQWRRYPRLVDSLGAQAALNGGAWPFNERERALLSTSEETPIKAAYFPIRTNAPVVCPTVSMANEVTRAVAQQYERWPYPAWRRLTVRPPKRLPDVIRKKDPASVESLPVDADILVAGCGTGREAASVALDLPDARVTAIDISETSLRYARRQCAAVGALNVQFALLDLHHISELGQEFDAIYCSGVLHHLPHPEQGWAALTAVLRAGGVMRIAVYSRISRLGIVAARTLIRDLLGEQISDDLLRRVRQRLLDQTVTKWALRSRDFYSLSGVHDLLFHRHEDPFDIPRIAKALDQLGLRLLSFSLPTPDAAARYDKQFPDDPLHRDLRSWLQFEKSEPFIFAGMYKFWCRKPTDR
jgi:2-polyprenyl-3-methyl-5-hydroxy-6-metoxy-1,4-benzoquinol methylase